MTHRKKSTPHSNQQSSKTPTVSSSLGSTSEPRIPPELQEHVIDIFVRDEPQQTWVFNPLAKATFHKTLASFSLVSRTWYQRVAKIKFKKVQLDIVQGSCFITPAWTGSIPLALFLDLIDLHAFLSECIRTITVGSQGRRTNAPVSGLPPLETTLARLCTVVESSLEEIHVAFQGIFKDSLRKPMVSEFLTKLCSIARLESLRFSFSHAPTSCISAARSIKRLSFFDCPGLFPVGSGSQPLLTSFEALNLTSTARQPLEEFSYQFEDLDANSGTNTLQQLVTLGKQETSFSDSWSKLRHVDLTLPNLSPDVAEWIFPRGLQSLALILNSRDNYLSSSLTQSFGRVPWASLSNLKTLRVDLCLGQRDMSMSQRYVKWKPVPENSFLLLCSDLPCLQTLKIHFYSTFIWVYTRRNDVVFAMDHVWKESIDGCFALPRYSALKRLVIKVSLTLDYDDQMLIRGGLDDVIKIALPSLFGSGGRVSKGLDVSVSSVIDVDKV